MSAQTKKNNCTCIGNIYTAAIVAEDQKYSKKSGKLDCLGSIV
jgi:hypothetical protein